MRPNAEFVRLLDAADAFDKEKARWMIRYNKTAEDFQFEVCRRDDGNVPSMVVGARSMKTAESELDDQARAAGMKAAIAVASAPRT